MSLRINITLIYPAHQQHLLTLLIVLWSEPHRIGRSAHAYSLSMYPVHRIHQNWHFKLNWTRKAAYRFHGYLSLALKPLSLKPGFQRGRRLMFKTNFEIAKVGTSCYPEMDSGLNQKIGLDEGHCQLSNAPLDAFGFRLPAKLCSSRQKSLTRWRS